MAAHRYWRARNPTGSRTPPYLACAKLKLKDTYGGTDRANGNTGIASTTYAGYRAPVYAFDSDINSEWNSDGSLPVGGDWIGVDFGVGVTWDIVEIEWSASNSGTFYDPLDLYIEYSDNGTTWTLAWKISNIGSFARAETKVFTNQPVQIRDTQTYTLTAVNFPTPQLRSTQAFNLVLAKGTTTLLNTQSYVLVAIKTGSEERLLRAWTFTQDDHDFYVLQLSFGTYVYDKLSDQWCQWTSPDAAYWRGLDGCDWQGINVCCDPDTGKIFKIDADNRLDYGTTPITSVVFGGMTERFRNNAPAYMAEVAISNARPPVGIAAGAVGIRLRSSNTLDGWVDHGTIAGLATGNTTYMRFYGLGLMRSPGHLFEITDTGYARRIDGLNVEVGGVPDGG